MKRWNFHYISIEERCIFHPLKQHYPHGCSWFVYLGDIDYKNLPNKVLTRNLQ